MSKTANVLREAKVAESGGPIESQLERHVAKLSSSIQATHRLMLVLEAITAILYVGLLILAVYVSATWKTHGALAVPRWWMASQIGVALLLVTLGLHTRFVQAYLPVPYPGGKESIVTGRQALRKGSMLIGLGLLWAVTWVGMYVGIVLTGAKPLESFVPFVVILSVGIGVISGVVSVIQKRIESR